MAEFSRLVVTRKGQALIAKILAGLTSEVNFTKIAAADTAYSLKRAGDSDTNAHPCRIGGADFLPFGAA